jgi:hypothetical protein
MGPSCPVERTQPDPNCADRPQAATFSIDTPTGTHVANVGSNAEGEFTMLLPAGTYVISLRETAAMPSMAAQTFEVLGNKNTELSLKLDSGIRKQRLDGSSPEARKFVRCGPAVFLRGPMIDAAASRLSRSVRPASRHAFSTARENDHGEPRDTN